ncbi:MAG: hypothetical protein NVS3B14_11830 [Ktedonobacteraceae bacterium]
MHGSKTILDKLLYGGIAGERLIIVQAKERKHKPAEPVRSWIDSDLLKENASLTNGCTDATIENIPLECANNTLCNLKEYVVAAKLICPHQD